ncbi:MAG: glycosyl transferase group 1 [Acidobacteria bacterium]|nr:glycosyl transferase group 1 [Acidobacteriota bacterium]
MHALDVIPLQPVFASATMKVILLHHRLGGYGSHHFNESHGFRLELARRGKKLVLLVNREAEPRVVAELGARAVLDDPTFRLEWSFAERSRRFLEMLHAQVDRLVKRDDWLLVTIATQLEADALTRWLPELAARKKPWIVVLFLSDRWNRAGREEHDRQMDEFGQLAADLAALTPGDARRIVFCTLTELLAAELTGLLGTKVETAPMPQLYVHPPPGPAGLREGAPPRVALLGGTRREKGSHLIPEIIRACRALVPVEFLVHLSNDTLSAAEAERLARIADEPGVTVIPEALPLEAYERAWSGADIALFPYQAIPYRQRTSGVFGEAVAYGIPVVATPGTWLAEQIEAGRAAGTIADSHEPEAIARAIARCVSELEVFRRKAAAVSDAWRRTVSLSAFVDVVEAEIARRAAEEPPVRRSWRDALRLR